MILSHNPVQNDLVVIGWGTAASQPPRAASFIRVVAYHVASNLLIMNFEDDILRVNGGYVVDAPYAAGNIL
jgi:hypothetical protein